MSELRKMPIFKGRRELTHTLSILEDTLVKFFHSNICNNHIGTDPQYFQHCINSLPGSEWSEKVWEDKDFVSSQNGVRVNVWRRFE